MYDGFRRINGTKNFARISSIKDVDGRLLSDEREVKERWKEYFETLYNDPNPTQNNTLPDILIHPNEEGEANILVCGVYMAIEKLKLHKATGIDGITAEEIKASTTGVGLSVLHMLCQRIWTTEAFLDE